MLYTLFRIATYGIASRGWQFGMACRGEMSLMTLLCKALFRCDTNINVTLLHFCHGWRDGVTKNDMMASFHISANAFTEDDPFD